MLYTLLYIYNDSPTICVRYLINLASENSLFMNFP